MRDLIKLGCDGNCVGGRSPMDLNECGCDVKAGGGDVKAHGGDERRR